MVRLCAPLARRAKILASQKRLIYKPTNSFYQILSAEAYSKHGFTVVPFRQGFKDMSPPSQEFMRLALEGRLHHGGNEVLAWMVDNIHIRTDPAGNIKPDKAISTEKIDGVVATIMALDRAIRNGGQHTESVCDSGGLLVL